MQVEIQLVAGICMRLLHMQRGVRHKWGAAAPKGWAFSVFMTCLAA